MIDDMDRTIQKLLEMEFGRTLPFDLSFAVPDRNFTRCRALLTYLLMGEVGWSCCRILLTTA